MSQMIKPDIPEICEFPNEGILRGKSLVYYIQPGVEGEIYGLNRILNSLKTGRTCVYIASSTSPDVILNQFKEMGCDIDQFKNRLFFVDAFNPLIRLPSKEKYVVSNPDNIHDLSESITDLLKKLPSSIVLFGSLSTIMDLCGEEETIEAVRTWNKTATEHKHTILYNFTAWPYSRQTLDLMQKDLFNAVISVGAIAEPVLFDQYCRILKSDWE